MTGTFPQGAAQIVDMAAGLSVPPALQAGIDRHRTHLAQLVITLRAAGVPEAQVAASVATLSASYRTELIQVLKSLSKANNAAG